MTREEKAYIKALRSRGIEIRSDASTPELQEGKPESLANKDFGLDLNALANTEAAVDNTKVDFFNVPVEEQYQAEVVREQNIQKERKDLLKELERRSQTDPNAFNNYRQPTGLFHANTAVDTYKKEQAAKQKLEDYTALGVAGTIGLGAGAAALTVPAVATGLNAAFVGHGIHSLPGTVEAWRDPNVSAWDAAGKTAWNVLDFVGAPHLAGQAFRGGKAAQAGSSLGETSDLFSSISSSPFLKKAARTVLPPLFNAASKLERPLRTGADHLHGASQIFKSGDSRKFFEKFPITAAQKEAATLKQNEAFAEAMEFRNMWNYDSAGNLTPYVKSRIEAIPRRGGMAIDVPAVPIKGIEGRNVNVASVPDLLVSTRSAENVGLSEVARNRIASKRGSALGVNYSDLGHEDPMSLTFRNKGLFSRPPEEVGRTGIHEGMHTFQQKQRLQEFSSPGGFSHMSRPWMDFLQESKTYPYPELNHLTPKNYKAASGLESDLGQQMADVMNTDKYWYGSAAEVHSELGGARLKTAKDLIAEGKAANLREAVDLMQSFEGAAHYGPIQDAIYVNFMNARRGKNQNFFKDFAGDRKPIIDIFRQLPAFAPVVGVAGAAAEGRRNPVKMDAFGNSYKEGGAPELQRGAIEDGVALAPDTGEIFLDQDKGAMAKAARTAKAKSKKEERALAKKLGNLRRARSNENVQWLLYNIYKHESDKDAQGNVNLGGFNLKSGISSAFGSGQFIGTTRNSVLGAYGLDAWSANPIEQEMATIALLEMNGLLKDAKKGKFKGNALTERVKVIDKSKPEGYRMDVQNWEAFVDDNKSRLIDKPKKKAETREWKRKLGTYRQNARYAPDESFSKIKPEVQSQKADLYKRKYEGVWPTGETIAPEGMPAVDFVMPGDTTNVRQQEVTVSSPKFVPAEEERSTATQQGIQELPYKHGGVESFNPNSKENLAYAKALRKNGVKVSSTGYKHDSPDRNNAANLIVGDNINGTNLTMEGVPHGVRATGVDTGKTVDMMPGVKSYSFPQDSSVMEVPLKRHGGREIPEYQSGIANELSPNYDAGMGYTPAPYTDAYTQSNAVVSSDYGDGSAATGDKLKKDGKGMGFQQGLGYAAAAGNIVGDFATAFGSEGTHEVAGTGSMTGETEGFTEGTVGGTLSAIPIVGQFYQLGSGIGDGFEAGANAFYAQGHKTEGEVMTGLQAHFNPSSQFGRNAELWEAGYLSNEEALGNLALSAVGLGGLAGLDRRVKEIQRATRAGAMSRATGGMHQRGVPTAETSGKFSRATGYPKPRI